LIQEQSEACRWLDFTFLWHILIQEQSEACRWIDFTFLWHILIQEQSEACRWLDFTFLWHILIHEQSEACRWNAVRSSAFLAQFPIPVCFPSNIFKSRYHLNIPRYHLNIHINTRQAYFMCTRTRYAYICKYERGREGERERVVMATNTEGWN